MSTPMNPASPSRPFLILARQRVHRCERAHANRRASILQALGQSLHQACVRGRWIGKQGPCAARYQHVAGRLARLSSTRDADDQELVNPLGFQHAFQGGDRSTRP